MFDTNAEPAGGNLNAFLRVLVLAACVIVGCSEPGSNSNQGSTPPSNAPDRQTGASGKALHQYSTVTAGFQNTTDLFECFPGDEVGLEETEEFVAMRWEIKYVKGQLRPCVKQVNAGALSGMASMRDRKSVV